MNLRAVMQRCGIFRVLVGLICWALGASFTVASPSSTTVMPKIIGGDPTAIGDYPWAVSLQSVNGSHFCGGVLIHQDWVLTAAHCVDSQRAESLRLVIGARELNKANSQQIFNADFIFIHPDYDPTGTFYSDIAIIHIKNEDGKEVSISPIPVMTPVEYGELTPGDTVTAMGWGLTDSSDQSSISNTLLEVDLPFLADSTCQTVFGTPQSGYWDRSVCAGAVQNKDSCSGDSGGPLIYNDNGTVKLLGLVSWGTDKGCGVEDFPGVYTQVPEFETWIRERQNSISIAGFSKIGFVGLGRVKQETYKLINFSDSAKIIQNATIAAGGQEVFALPDVISELQSVSIPANGERSFTIQALGSQTGEHNSYIEFEFLDGTDATVAELDYPINSKVLYGPQTRINQLSSFDVKQALSVDWPMFTGTNQNTEHAQPWFSTYDSELGEVVLQSGPIEHNERSVLLTYLNGGSGGDELRFDASTDAEEFDLLYVFVNERLAATVPQNNWQEGISARLDSGQNHVLFIYIKDHSQSEGRDAAFLKNFRVCSVSAPENQCVQSNLVAYVPDSDETTAVLESTVSMLGRMGREPEVQARPKKSSSGFGALSGSWLLFLTLLLVLFRRVNVR